MFQDVLEHVEQKWIKHGSFMRLEAACKPCIFSHEIFQDLHKDLLTPSLKQYIFLKVFNPMLHILTSTSTI